MIAKVEFVFIFIPLQCLSAQFLECRDASKTCCDRHELCQFWGTINECANNEQWMTINCRMSCNACFSPAPRAPIVKQAQLRPDAEKIAQSASVQQSKNPKSSRGPIRQGNNNPQQCLKIQSESSNDVIDEMKDAGLVSEFEDTSNRRLIGSLDIAGSNSQFGCAPQMDGNVDCTRNACFNNLYRSFDGVCNNFRNPLWGASAIPYLRLKPFDYDDGVDAPTSSLKGGRPSAREASRFLLSSAVSVAAGRWNSLLMQFGQFIVHDISKTSILPTDQCPLCADIPGKCFPIKVDPSDQRFGCPQPPCCLGFTRSAPVCGMSPRIRLNENTAFIDGSQIYSSSSLDAARLRDPQSAALRQSFFNNKPFMPFDSNQCFGPGSCTANFDTGDNRVSIFVGLAALHTIFLREHNRLAAGLRQLNPHWSNDRVFQEARKIVGAQLQVITSKFWLPKVLGSDEPLGPYKGYNPNVNPTIADEFANGAMRFGHGMVQEFFNRVDANGQPIPEGQMRVDNGVLQPQKLLFEGGPDAIVRGMMMTPLKKPQRLTTALTENMFGTADLGAVNIQRGRDAGVPGYNTWREFCGLPRANSFDELANEFPDPVLRNNLRQGYSHPDNVDLYVAALLEDPKGNSLVGPTIACMIRGQFQRIRDGDRFWYENPGIFTEDQLSELNKSTLARILCDNGDDFHLVVRDAFEVTDGQNLTPCQTIVSLDLRKWSD